MRHSHTFRSMGGTGDRGQGLGGTGVRGDKGLSYHMKHSHTFRVRGTRGYHII